MKSVAVAVLMAQSGMFVPCESMAWKPVRSVFTKIGSRDNIWKGKSTFITEMMELRHILERSDEHSLILCDELTSGTETFSATGIVASTIQKLAEQRSFFIMTTHLHTLKRFEDLPVRIMHIGMSYENKKLVFDRLLRDGMGKSIYGLEIAEYLGFSPEFVQRAYDFRGRLEEEPMAIIPNKRSRYNKKKIVDRCENCESTKDLHTHHVLPQADADEEGYIGTHHKNALHNLQILCRTCHEAEHHDLSNR
jgi:DNA mismatch repair protein MutS